MKELVGKYARFGNEIFEIEDELIDDIVHLIYDDKGLFLDILDKENNIVIKDDPRELIEVGDLVMFNSVKNNSKFVVRFIENKTQIQVYKDGWIMNNITEIYTKTSEDTFTRQWSDDE